MRKEIRKRKHNDPSSRFLSNSYLAIHLLKEHCQWKKAKFAYTRTFEEGNVTLTNDVFARHLLDVHGKHCSICREQCDPVQPLSVDKSKDNVESLLLDLNKTFKKRLRQVEKCIEELSKAYLALQNKVQTLSSYVSKQLDLKSEDGDGFESNISVIRLNKESDFPDGSWLGDESKPLERVRCHIHPTDLFHINANCNTAEKMALTLLDYLFDRETQAESNISGQGRHRKKQLNPLFVYGIQCHLKKKFGLDAKTWNRIKLNMDSKCRSAYRRKQHKGVPPKSTGRNSIATSDSEQNSYDVVAAETSGLETGFTLEVEMDQDSSEHLSKTEIIQTEDGEIQIFRAVSDTLAQMEDIQQFQIVADEHLLSVINNQAAVNKKIE